MTISVGNKVVVTETIDQFEYTEGDTGTVTEIELRPNVGGPTRMALVRYDDNQDPGWVHVENLQVVNA